MERPRVLSIVSIRGTFPDNRFCNVFRRNRREIWPANFPLRTGQGTGTPILLFWRKFFELQNCRIFLLIFFNNYDPLKFFPEKEERISIEVFLLCIFFFLLPIPGLKFLELLIPESSAPRIKYILCTYIRDRLSMTHRKISVSATRFFPYYTFIRRLFV